MVPAITRSSPGVASVVVATAAKRGYVTSTIVGVLGAGWWAWCAVLWSVLGSLAVLLVLLRGRRRSHEGPLPGGATRLTRFSRGGSPI